MLSISIHWNCGHFTEADLVQLLSPIREADVLGSTGLMLWSYLEEHLEKPRPLRVCLQLPEWMIDFYLGRVFLWSSFGILDFVHFCSSKVAIRVRRAIWSWHCKTVRRLRAVPPPSCHVWTCDFVSCGGKTTPDDAMPRVLRLGVEVLLLLIVTGQLSCLVLLHSVQVSVWICLFLQCWIGILQLSIKIYDSWVCHFFSESWVEAFSVSHVARCCLPSPFSPLPACIREWGCHLVVWTAHACQCEWWMLDKPSKVSRAGNMRTLSVCNGCGLVDLRHITNPLTVSLKSALWPESECFSTAVLFRGTITTSG